MQRIVTLESMDHLIVNVFLAHAILSNFSARYGTNSIEDRTGDSTGADDEPATGSDSDSALVASVDMVMATVLISSLGELF